MSLTKVSNLELLHCPDCIDLCENGKCRLFQLPCKGHACTFLRTRQDAAHSFLRAASRLSRLDEETQSRIARKYFKGLRPWVGCVEQ